MSQHILAAVMFGLTVGFAEPAAAQCTPIPESIELVRPRPFVTARISEFMVAPFDQAIKEADVILVGSLTRSKVYLSEDKCTLYTDYTVTPTRVVFPQAPTQPRPSLPTVVVRTWGGETTITGVPVKIYDSNLRGLNVDRPYLLLLKLDQKAGKYEIYDYGAYALEVGPDNRLIANVKTKGLMDAAIEGADLDDAISVVQQRRSR